MTREEYKKQLEHLQNPRTWTELRDGLIDSLKLAVWDEGFTDDPVEESQEPVLNPVICEKYGQLVTWKDESQSSQVPA